MSQMRGKQRQTYRLTDLIDPQATGHRGGEKMNETDALTKAVAAWVSAVLPHLGPDAAESLQRDARRWLRRRR